MWLIKFHDMVCYVKPKITFQDFWDRIYFTLPVISPKHVPKRLLFWGSDSQIPSELKDSYCFKAKTQILDQIVLTSPEVVTLITVWYFSVEDIQIEDFFFFF